MTDGPGVAQTPTTTIEILGDGRIVAREGSVGTIIGEVRDSTVTLNLGWCRAAGISVRCLDDPEVDSHRGGLTLDRPAVR